MGHIYLIDASGYIFRAYHALPPLTRKSDAHPVGAVAGFSAMVFKLLNETQPAPTHIGAIFDTAAPTFRKKIYQDYKAHRPPPPDELRVQFPLVHEATKAFGLFLLAMDGFEADDIIASYTRAARAKKWRVTIVSSDKDLMQLVGDGVEMLDTMKPRQIGPAEVQEKFGVPPDKVIEVQALAGDASDNVPGVPGIGIKTAAELINTYGDLETLLQKTDEIRQPKRKAALVEHADQARISRELVTLKTDVPRLAPLSALRHKPPEPAALFGFLKAMEFVTLTKRIASKWDMDADAYGADATLASKASKAAGSAPSATSATRGRSTAKKAAHEPQPFMREDYACVQDVADLRDWVARARAQGYVAVDTETSSLEAAETDLLGFSLALAPNQACYVPLAHTDEGGARLASQLTEKQALAEIKDLFADAAVLKILHNAKFDMLVLRQRGIKLAPLDDTLLVSYVLDTGRGRHGLDALALRYCDHAMLAYKDMVGSGKDARPFAAVGLADATQYGAEDADACLRLWLQLKPRLLAEHHSTVYETLERPLVDVLVAMEAAGVRLDEQALKESSAQFAKQMATTEKQVHKLAGREFNLGSPAQLGEVLFAELGLPGGSKTKTGAWATPGRVLEDLAAQGHEIAAHALSWRGLAKLRSTYTEALGHYVLPHSGRVHSSYALAATTTGRLSSSDPNLQNIPIRTSDGRQVRRAFIAPPKHVLLSADYSQIELRVLAHVANIAPLQEAFAKGADIHALTAAEMFGGQPDKVTSEQRRRAKAINFGIIYGISAFGLARQLSIPRDEAAAYIKSYFERFPGIQDYMRAQRELVREEKPVRTLFGRRIHYNLKAARTPAERGFLERAAINAPIQGGAADIMRRAMIHMQRALERARSRATMLMQVHDELIFECPEKDAEKTAALARQVMEQACAPVLKLAVPLVVDVAWGKNWDEAH